MTKILFHDKRNFIYKHKHFIKTPKRLEAFQLTSVGVGTSSLVSSGALMAIIVWSLKTSILQMSSYVT